MSNENDVKVTITVEYRGTTISESVVGRSAGNPLFAPRVANEAANDAWNKVKPMLVARTGDIDDPANVEARQAYGITT